MLKTTSTAPRVRPRRVLPAFAAAAIAAACLNGAAAAASAPGRSGASRLAVVAGENPWGNIAAQIGGTHVQVVSILNNPNADPHLYESDAQDAAEVAKARVLIANGLGYDDFVGRLAAASPSPHRTMLVAADIVHVSGDDANPHLWYGIGYVREVARAIAATFERLDPSHRRGYAASLATFDASLAPWQDAIAAIRDRFRGDRVAYTERVPGYLVAAAGLANATPAAFALAVEDGSEPSPQAAAEMDGLIEHHGIRALLYNVQATAQATSVVRALAQKANVPVVPVSETLPASDRTFQQWQTAQTRALLDALER